MQKPGRYKHHGSFLAWLAQALMFGDDAIVRKARAEVRLTTCVELSA